MSPSQAQTEPSHVRNRDPRIQESDHKNKSHPPVFLYMNNMNETTLHMQLQALKHAGTIQPHHQLMINSISSTGLINVSTAGHKTCEHD